MGKKTIVTIIIILIILLGLAIGYIGYDKYSQYQLQKQLSIYQQGAQLGYEQAIAQLMQGAIACNQVPVTYNNQTVNLVAVECFQQLAQQAQG